MVSPHSTHPLILGTNCLGLRKILLKLWMWMGPDVSLQGVGCVLIWLSRWRLERGWGLCSSTHLHGFIPCRLPFGTNVQQMPSPYLWPNESYWWSKNPARNHNHQPLFFSNYGSIISSVSGHKIRDYTIDRLKEPQGYSFTYRSSEPYWETSGTR